METIIYTDGACSGNPGPGGYAAIMVARNNGEIRKLKSIQGGESETTNNRMELTAVIKALEAINKSCTVTIISDSRYVTDNWARIPLWKQRNWQSSCGEIKNKDLWQTLENTIRKKKITVLFEHCQGHAGVTFNEQCDALARTEAQRWMT